MVQASTLPWRPGLMPWRAGRHTWAQRVTTTHSKCDQLLWVTGCAAAVCCQVQSVSCILDLKAVAQAEGGRVCMLAVCIAAQVTTGNKRLSVLLCVHAAACCAAAAVTTCPHSWEVSSMGNPLSALLLSHAPVMSVSTQQTSWVHFNAGFCCALGQLVTQTAS